MLLDLFASSHPLVGIAATMIAVAGMLFVLWRLWRFTLMPHWRPHEPKELPYWIPILGHAIAFFTNADALLTRGREFFGNTREPFAITLGGELLYVITSAESVNEVFKNTSSLTFDGYIEYVLSSFGASLSFCREMFHPSPNGIVSLQGVLHRPFTTLSHVTKDLYQQQLLPGGEYDILVRRLIHSIDESLQWEKMPHIYNSQSKSREMNISLLQWCGDTLNEASIMCLFGSRIFQVDPSFAQNLFDFNQDAWKLLFRYPQPAARKTYRVKKKLTDALEAYFHLPKEERAESAWIIQELEAQHDRRGVDIRDRAILALMVLWVATHNTHKLGFWILIYLSHDPSLMAAIRAETSPAIIKNTIDPSYLMRNSPRLEAMSQEVLRVLNAATSIRQVVSPTEVGGKLFRSGNKVLMPYQQLHQDEDVWGVDASRYDPERFLKRSKMLHSPSYRPFGGGTSLCSGRFLGKQGVFLFVALALHRFQIKVVTNQSDLADADLRAQIPGPDKCEPRLGIMGPQKGSNVMITIRERLVSAR